MVHHRATFLKPKYLKWANLNNGMTPVEFVTFYKTIYKTIYNIKIIKQFMTKYKLS